MIQLDERTQSSITNRFGLTGTDNDGSVTVSKETIASLSKSFTSLQNAFNAVQTHNKNIGKIQEAVTAGSKNQSAERNLENPRASSPTASVVGEASDITALLPQLSEALKQLGKSIEQLDLSPNDQTAGDSSPTGTLGSGRGPSLKTIGKIGLGAAAVGAVGYGAYSLMSGDDEPAPTPTSPELSPTDSIDTPPRALSAREPGPAAPDTVITPEVLAPVPVAPPAPAPSDVPSYTPPTRAPRTEESEPADDVAEREDTILETVKKTDQTPVAIKEAAPSITPTAASSTDKITSFLQRATRTVNAFVRARPSQPTARPATKVGGGGFSGGGGSGGGGGASGDFSGGAAPAAGAAGTAVKPPSGGMAGLIYQTGKSLGYDDFMSIAFVSLAEKESGLKPQVENMNYSAERIKQVWKNKPEAVQYAKNPQGLANYVYGGKYGNKGPNDGWLYRGRGLNQITFKGNYEAVGKRIGYDLVKDPDALANNPEIAVKAFFDFYANSRVIKGRKTAASQSEANRIVTDATGGRSGFSSGSEFGAANLAKVEKLSSKYSAGGLASASTPSASAAPSSGANIGGFGGGASGGGSVGMGGKDVSNTDNIEKATKGKNIWDYARKNGSDVDWEGLKPGMKNRFLAMAIEFKEKTGRKVAINSGNRSYEKQAALYKKFGPRRAAPPGRSKHEGGVAIDINSPDGNEAHQMGLLKKYGFFRPYPSEPWHVEPIEAAKIKGQTDNPYNPGTPIAQPGKSGKPVMQDDKGLTKPVTAPARQVGPPSEGVVIQKKVAGQDKSIVVVPVGAPPQQTPGVGQYLAAIPPGKPPQPRSRNPTREYKSYFNAR